MAIARDTTSLWAWFAMGHCHFEQGRYLEAAGDFNACVARGPQYAWCHFNRALALARSGHLLDAKVSYDRANKLDAGLVEAQANRAMVELELGQTEEALADLCLAVAVGQDEPAVLTTLGETLARVGRRDEAEAMFRDLLGRGARKDLVLAVRGLTRISGDAAAANADFSAALRFNPRNALAHYGLGQLCRKGDPAAAIKHLSSAIELDRGFIDAVQLRALVRARIGDPSVVDDVDFLIKTPTPRRLYNSACALAVFADAANDARFAERAVELLERALKAGFSVQEALQDPDLRTIRSRPDFARVIAR
jgi:tetratricopeptide (TPR) repeat protein